VELNLEEDNSDSVEDTRQLVVLLLVGVGPWHIFDGTHQVLGLKAEVVVAVGLVVGNLVFAQVDRSDSQDTFVFQEEEDSWDTVADHTGHVLLAVVLCSAHHHQVEEGTEDSFQELLVDNLS